MNQSVSDIMKKILADRTPARMEDVDVKAITYNPSWIENEVQFLYTDHGRTYRSYQLRNSSIDTIKRYLRLLLEEHLRIDEIQEWLIIEIAKFEENFSIHLNTDSMQWRYSVSHLINNDGSELYQFRKNLLELVR